VVITAELGRIAWAVFVLLNSNGPQLHWAIFEKNCALKIKIKREKGNERTV
jgi:hypothetical protein